jgi:hypothetical protein
MIYFTATGQASSRVQRGGLVWLAADDDGR